MRWTQRSRMVGVAMMGLLLSAEVLEAQQLSLKSPPQSTRVFARDGSLIAELGPEVRTSVSLASLPAHVWKAFVAIEDRRFFEHGGVDPVGIARAITSTIQGDRQGASTITQQLIGAMYPELVDRREITMERKIREAKLAMDLESRYGKQKILEAYLNQIYLGHGWFGVEAAARHYFGKPARELSIAEAAMLAGLPKGPGLYSPKLHPARAKARRDLVLDAMLETGVINARQAAEAKRTAVKLAPNHGYSVRTGWVVDEVTKFLESRYGKDFGTKGLVVWTTLEPKIQTAAEAAVAEGLERTEKEPWFRGPKRGTPQAKVTPAGTPYLQGAAVTVDAQTGEILALVGGRDYRESSFNRVLASRRQPGSAFKPLIYAAALRSGFSPATLVEDTAISLPAGNGEWYEPGNSDNVFRGTLSVRDALRQSVNTVAIQLAMAVGILRIPEIAKEFGIETPIPGYASSAIGAGDLKPVELAGAYTVFANGGVRVEPFLIRRVTDASGRSLYEFRAKGYRVLDPAIAFLTADMLKDAAERGTGREARGRLPKAVVMGGKTGTTNSGADLWYAGFTPDLVSVVWAGFDRPKSVGRHAYGGSVAAPIWGDLMARVYQDRKVPEGWSPPEGVVSVAADPVTGSPQMFVCPETVIRLEYFLADQTPHYACRVEGGRVISPTGPGLPLLGAPADTLRADSVDLKPEEPDVGWQKRGVPLPGGHR